MSPLLILFICIAFIVIGVAWARIPAFFALLAAAVLAGILSPDLPGPETTTHAVRTVDLVMLEFGAMVGRIGFVIALASIIGVFLLESGAADKLIRRMIAVLGEKRAPFALMLSGFVLSVPVFFDTVFFLLIPLARALALRTGRNYLMYVLAICAGGVIAHAIVPPTPGPLITAELLGLDLGTAILGGIAAGLPVALVALAVAAWLSRRFPVPMRETAGASLTELRGLAEKPEAELPGFIVSILPIVLPVVLISAQTLAGLLDEETLGGLRPVIAFLGDKNIALFAGALAGGWLWAVRVRPGRTKWATRLIPPLETAGIIILITGAGGAFGAMIKHAGVGEALQSVAEEWGIGPILLAWGTTWLIRAAQGSGTVAMITGAGLMAGVVGDGSALPFHPVYIYLAIGFGSLSVSWMNDSGFWVVGRLSGMDEAETLRSWTLLLATVSFVGLATVLLSAWLLPLVN